MINNEELSISNASYINKDFASIFPELLTLWKKFTNEYDPETSNESDPGVVMLKILAFIADKLNYNVDKNVLERFMLSATQASSMRELCEMMGYDMKYFISAETYVSFLYTGDKLLDGTSSFEIPRFTVITNQAGDIQYITTQEAVIQQSDTYTSTVPVIEGELTTLYVNGTDVIKLNNLDDTRRVYFPTSRVAQNGIFVTSLDTGREWVRSMNLNSELLRQEVYKFGYDSIKKAPYLEFPEDIANLIGSGLSIKYVISNGKDGNVKAKQLTVIASPTEFTIIGTEEKVSVEDGTLTVKNNSASINGSDPETIDEAYNNFKKTIGTFDTLVTCRDYANAIYSLEDGDGFPLVSNIQVCDRRDDYNFSTEVTSYNQYGLTHTIVPSGGITPFDLCLYPLTTITTFSSDGATEYRDSFKPSDANLGYIKDDIEDSKSISHTYKNDDTTNFNSGITYLFKNKYTLNANIYTTYKVGTFEQADILRNVESALIENFNSRKIDYGYEIPYDTILKVIKQADTRISSVNLAEPVLTTYVMTKGGIETPLISSEAKNDFANYIAKNVLAGRVPLWNYDARFDYEFGQKQVLNSGTPLPMVVEKLKSVTTSANIQVSEVPYTLKKNEVIQLISPSVITDVTYGAYVLVSFKSPSNNTIAANEIYKLKSDEYLTISLTNSDGIIETIVYEPGTVIKPNFDLPKTDDTTATRTVVGKTASQLNASVSTLANTPMGSVGGDYEGKYIFYSLTSSENIEIEKINSVDLTGIKNCYWIRNNAQNELYNNSDAIYVQVNSTEVTAENYSIYYIYQSGEYVHPDSYDASATYYKLYYEILLGDGEYFFWTDINYSNLISVGSGTTLRIPPVFSSAKADIVSYEAIEDDGLLSLRDVWKKANFQVNYPCTITENEILTLTENDTVSADITITLNNDFQEFKQGSTYGTLTYVIDGEQKSILPLNMGDEHRKIKSRLDIDASKTKAQTVGANQSISFTTEGGSVTSIGIGNSFLLSEDVQLSGGNNLDLSSLNLVTGSIAYPLMLYHFTQAENTHSEYLNRNSNDFAKVSVVYNDNIEWTIPKVAGGSRLMLYWAPVSGSNLHIQFFNGSSAVAVSDSIADSETKVVCTSTCIISSNDIVVANGIIMLEIPNTVDKIVFKVMTADEKGILSVDKLRYVDATNKYNPLLGLGTFQAKTDQNVSGLVETIVTAQKGFYSSASQDNDLAIRVDKAVSGGSDTLVVDMTSPYVLYDSNNVANHIVMSEIRLIDDGSMITIARSSRK